MLHMKTHLLATVTLYALTLYVFSAHAAHPTCDEVKKGYQINECCENHTNEVPQFKYNSDQMGPVHLLNAVHDTMRVHETCSGTGSATCIEILTLFDALEGNSPDLFKEGDSWKWHTKVGATVTVNSTSNGETFESKCGNNTITVGSDETSNEEFRACINNFDLFIEYRSADGSRRRLHETWGTKIDKYGPAGENVCSHAKIPTEDCPIIQYKIEEMHVCGCPLTCETDTEIPLLKDYKPDKANSGDKDGYKYKSPSCALLAKHLEKQPCNNIAKILTSKDVHKFIKTDAVQSKNFAQLRKFVTERQQNTECAYTGNHQYVERILNGHNRMKFVITNSKTFSNKVLRDALSLWHNNKAAANKKYGDISNWDTSEVTDMRHLFYNQKNFNADISKWDTGQVTDMGGMFQNAENFNQNIGGWDVRNVIHMEDMFNYADVFNQDLSKWDVSKVTRMDSMFKEAYAFNGDISKWNVAKVTHMSHMFDHAVTFNQNIGDWDVSSVGWMQYAFNGATDFNQNLSKWTPKLKWVDTINYMFHFATSQSYPFANPRPENIGNTPYGYAIDMKNVCTGVNALSDDCAKCDTDKLYFPNTDGNCVLIPTRRTQTNIGPAVKAWIKNPTEAAKTYGNISKWDTSRVTDMSSLFNGATTFNEDISQWDVSKVTTMRAMFAAAESFNQNIGDWDTSHVTTMEGMFAMANVFNQDLSKWNMTKVTTTHQMFAFAPKFNGDVSKWDMEAVTDTGKMFNGARTFNQDLSKWKLPSVKNMDDMFSLATLFSYPFKKPEHIDKADNMCGNVVALINDCTQCNNDKLYYKNEHGRCIHIPTRRAGNKELREAVDAWFHTTGQENSEARRKYGHISAWDTSRVTDMSGLFQNKGQSDRDDDISGWDTSHVTTMKQMFNHAIYFNQDLSKWDVSKVTDTSEMFRYALQFNGDVSTWFKKDHSSLLKTDSMFSQAEVFNGDVSNWDVSKVTDMESMFFKATEFNQDVSNWNVENVRNLVHTFRGASSFDQDLSKWTSKLINIQQMGEMLHLAKAYSYPLKNPWSGEQYSHLMDDVCGSVTALTTDCEKCNIDERFFMNAVGRCVHMPTMRTDKDIKDAVKAWLANPETAAEKYGHIKDWDTHLVTNMYQLFALAYDFNEDISNWDTSQVTNMYGMFEHAYAFNGNISKWNMGSVQTTEQMFYEAKAFNQDLSNWNVSSVTSAYNMFYGAANLSYPFIHLTTLTGKCLEVPALTNNCECNGQSQYTKQPNGQCVHSILVRTGNDDIRTAVAAWLANPGSAADKYGDIKKWDTHLVTDMTKLFQYARTFNEDISDWNVANVITMKQMFQLAKQFNKPIGKWNTGKVTDMSEMFQEAIAFNQNIGYWNVEHVTTMEHMFYDATSFNQDISNWNVEKVLDMNYMFYKATAFNQDISPWNPNSVQQISMMFANAVAFDQDLSGWHHHNHMNNVVNSDGILNGATSYSYIFQKPTNAHDTPMCEDVPALTSDCGSCNSDYAEHRSGYSYRCHTLLIRTDHDMKTAVQKWLKNETDATTLYGHITGWDTSRVTDMRDLFRGTDAATFNADISGWDTSKVTTMFNMFSGAHEFNQNISTWKTEKVTNMASMFAFTAKFNQDIGSWDTAKVTDMAYMFNNAKVFNQDISNWQMSKVTDIRGMFAYAHAFNGDVSKWDLSKVTNSENMFEEAKAFNQIVSFGENDAGCKNADTGVRTGCDRCQYVPALFKDCTRCKTEDGYTDQNGDRKSVV